MEGFIRLENRLGTVVLLASYGARWVDLRMPDESGDIVRPVLGFDHPALYASAGEQYHGAMVGRVCGRISGASFEIDGETFSLERNDSYGYPYPNHLHGGRLAFHNRVWQSKKYMTRDGDEAVEFSLFSPDGENGYPGNVMVRVTYVLMRCSNVVRIHSYAETDRKTPISLTNHTFFNLNGHRDGMDASDHLLSMASASLIECDSELVPTGKVEGCRGRWFDFVTKPVSFAEVISKGSAQVRRDGGFSLSFALEDGNGVLRKIATLTDPVSGRRMDLLSDQPSLQVYTAYFMDGRDVGHSGCAYSRTAGVALEPQGWPDAVNHPEFPSVYVTPEKPYTSLMEYRFA